MDGEYLGIVSSRKYERLCTLQERLEKKGPFLKNFHPYRRIKREFEGMALHRSTDLENPDKKIKGRTLKKMYQAAGNALRLINSKNWKDWDETDLKEVNFLITQAMHPYGYRDKHKYIESASNSLPAPGRIQRETPSLFRLLRDHINPLETAILFHFHGVRIHPFEDGNGRTFRLLQDSIFYQENLPPLILHMYERERYISSIENAAVEWIEKYNKIWDKKMVPNDFYLKLLKEGSGKSMNEFSDFIADRLLQRFGYLLSK